MLQLVDRHIFPSGQKALEKAKRTVEVAAELGPDSASHLRKRVAQLVRLVEELIKGRDEISAELELHDDDLMKEAKHIDQVLNPLMVAVRKTCDDLEGFVAAEDWTLPTYHEMLFVAN
jgi:glutamine synthetase type III